MGISLAAVRTRRNDDADRHRLQPERHRAAWLVPQRWRRRCGIAACQPHRGAEDSVRCGCTGRAAGLPAGGCANPQAHWRRGAAVGVFVSTLCASMAQ